MRGAAERADSPNSRSVDGAVRARFALGAIAGPGPGACDALCVRAVAGGLRWVVRGASPRAHAGRVVREGVDVRKNPHNHHITPRSLGAGGAPRTTRRADLFRSSARIPIERTHSATPSRAAARSAGAFGYVPVSPSVSWNAQPSLRQRRTVPARLVVFSTMNGALHTGHGSGIGRSQLANLQAG
jgi:hypothetical protein